MSQRMPLRVYVCHAPEDRRYREALERHLSPLERAAQIQTFSEDRIRPGAVVSQEVTKALQEAQLVLLLMSPDFLASDRCMDVAQRAQSRPGVSVVPILIRATLWQSTPFAGLKVLPLSRRPVRSWRDEDEVWMEVATELQDLIKEISEGMGARPPAAASSDPAPRAAMSAPPAGEGHVDLGILVALREEFRELFAEIRASHQVVARGDHRYYRFTRPAAEPGQTYQCVALYIGEMNPTPAALAAERMMQDFAPTTVAMIGIAAGIDPEIRLGDVVAASQVDSYLESAKAVNAPAGFDFLPGGEVYRTSQDLMREVRNFEFAFDDVYSHWHKDCAEDLRKLIPEDERRGVLVRQGLLQEAPKLLDGHIASGSVVGAAAEFGRWLRRRDRKALALEMESAGVLVALQSYLAKAKTLVLRGISDLGDERKGELDALEGGVLRRYAIRNTIRMLFGLLRAGVLPRR